MAGYVNGINLDMSNQSNLEYAKKLKSMHKRFHATSDPVEWLKLGDIPEVQKEEEENAAINYISDSNLLIATPKNLVPKSKIRLNNTEESNLVCKSIGRLEIDDI